MNLLLRPIQNPFDPDNEDLDFTFLLREDETDEETQTLDLSNSDLPWKTLQFDLEATLPRVDLERILPAPSSPSGDSTLVVSLICSQTRTRRAIPLAFTGEAWTGTVSIRRDEAWGSVRLVPHLARRTDIPLGRSELGSYATRRGFLLAEGRGLNIRIDPTPSKLDGILRIRWDNFSESENPWLRSHQGDVLHLDQDDSAPTLYLNSAYPELKAALHSKSKRGSTAVMRNIANALIAQAAWTALFATAVDLADFELEGDESLTDSWRGKVLQAFLPQAFPGVDESEQRARLKSLKESGQQSVLMSVITSAAQSAARTGSLVKRASGAAVLSGGEE